MKKTLAALSILSVLPNAYAGAMGPVATETPLIQAFATGEAAYTWNSLMPGQINHVQSLSSTNGWGGRVAGGFLLNRGPNWGLTGEAGWGSYGTTNFTAISSGEVLTSIYINGFDLLLGALYRYNQFDFYAKAGALIENLSFEQSIDLAKYTPGGLISGSDNLSTVYTFAIPEVKVGVEYNVNEHLGVSVGYMYVFGSNRDLYINNQATSSSISLVSNKSFQGLTINSVLFGLRYYI